MGAQLIRKGSLSWYNNSMVCIKCKADKVIDKFLPIKHLNGKVYYTKKCRKCSSALATKRLQEFRSPAWFSKRYQRVKYRAKKYNRVFSLTRGQCDELYNQEKCYYCEEVTDMPSIDRVNNDVGYIISNCVMSCMDCNMLKGSLKPVDKTRMKAILSKI